MTRRKTNSKCRRWTKREDAKLISLWKDKTEPELISLIGRPRGGIRSRALKLGLYRKGMVRPSVDRWHAAARVAAAELDIDPAYVIGGRRFKIAVVARNLAVRRLMDEGRFSVSGIAHVIGLHHTTLLHHGFSVRKWKVAPCAEAVT